MDNLHIDIHLENRKGHRYLERITEIIPIQEMEYPSDVDPNKKHEADELEYFKRQTDRKMFEERDLVRYVNGEFVLVHLPSKTMVEDIKKKLTLEEEKEFIEDLKMIRSLKRNPCKGEPEKAVVIPEIFDPD